MICPCCKIVVKSELEKMGINHKVLDLGEVEILENVSEEQLKKLDSALKQFSLELIKDKKSKVVEKIKIAVSDLVNRSDEEEKVNLSDYINNKLNRNYNYLNHIFKQETGTTIDKYFISKKIERVKELISFNDMNLSEIAYKLQYSSLAHLSNQFKKVTGLHPSYFKQFKYKPQEALATM